MEQSNNKPFRISAAKLFLTYSQCDCTRQEIKTHLEVVGGKMREWIIAREHHKDNKPHIHAVVHYETKFESRNVKVFDYQGHHPNIATLKTKADFVRTCDYLMKEDVEVLKQLEGNTREERNKAIYDELMKVGPDKLMMEGKIHPFQYSGYKRTYLEHKATITIDEREDLPVELENPWTTPFKVDNDLKKCHLWIYSHRPNQGKTTWGDQLTQKYRAEFYHYSEIFQSQITPRTEMIIMDEFRGQLKVYQLNQICDGKNYFTKKGQPNFKLENKPIVVVLSNKMICEVYKKELDVELVYARFTEIEANLPLNIVKGD